MRVFANHIGFDKTDDKTAVLELEKEAAKLTAWLEADDGERYDVSVSGPERIPDWSGGCYSVLDFQAGRHVPDCRKCRREGIPVRDHSDHRIFSEPAHGERVQGLFKGGAVFGRMAEGRPECAV